MLIYFDVRHKTWEIKQLEQLFEELTKKYGGEIKVTEGAHPKTVKVFAKGCASFVYSAYSSFFNAENPLQESILDEQCVGEFTIVLDGLRQKFQERNSLKFVQDYLTLQGFEVAVGSKPSPRVFPEADEFKRQDSIAFKQRFGVSLDLANQLHAEDALIVSMPFALAAETGDEALRDDLNFCFKELRLMAANGQAKQCIDLKTGRFLANIGSSQAVALEKHFQQRAMLLLNADDEMKEAVAVVGGPGQAVSKIRAQMMSYLERELPGNPQVALLEMCLRHPAQYVSGYDSCTQEDWVKRLEKIINASVIIGPSSFDFFLSPELLAVDAGAAEGSSASECVQALEKLLLSQALGDGINSVAKHIGMIPHKEEYLRQYTKMDANHNMAYQLRALDPRRTESERRGIVTEAGDVSGRLEQLRQFRVQHSPFYLIQHLSEKLRGLLQDAKEEKITEILAMLGFTEEQMSVFKIVGPNLLRYNVYHIEFMLPVLVLNFCLNHAMVLRPQCALPVDLKGYLDDPHNKITARDQQEAWRALEWSYNARFGCGWSAGETKRYDYSTGFGHFFGGSSTQTQLGGYKAPPAVEKTTKPTVYSSS